MLKLLRVDHGALGTVRVWWSSKLHATVVTTTSRTTGRADLIRYSIVAKCAHSKDEQSTTLSSPNVGEAPTKTRKRPGRRSAATMKDGAA